MAVNELSDKGMTSWNECSHCIQKKKVFFLYFLSMANLCYLKNPVKFWILSEALTHFSTSDWELAIHILEV